MSRIRTILVLGYWVLGNIHRYWVVLLLGSIFCCSDTQCNTTNQTAVSTVHMPVNDYLHRVRKKKRPEYFSHNFDKFRYSCVIFGTNRPDTSLH